MPSLLFVPAKKISVDNNFPGFGAVKVKVKEKGVKLIRFGVHCSADSRFNTTAVQNKVPALPNWQKIPEPHKIGEDDKVSKCIKSIQEMFRSMDDGVTSISAYDTAWVALVEDSEKTGVPMFPSSLEWIADNQLSDGSWGDDKLFLAHDRILNTLACVVALKTWNVHPQKMERGLLFIRENINKLADVKIEHTTMGFEIVFPSLVEVAESLNIEIPKNLPIMKEIYAQRDLKRSRIPKDKMHEVPTTLLYSLEGMVDLKWENLLKLRCEDGSFLSSPSSTAYALMQTKDAKCFDYLNKAIQKFNGGGFH